MKNRTKERRPAFTRLSSGTPKGQTFTSTVIRIVVDTEKEAREWCSRWALTFAAKIRSEYPLASDAFEQAVNGMMKITPPRNSAGEMTTEVCHA